MVVINGSQRLRLSLGLLCSEERRQKGIQAKAKILEEAEEVNGGLVYGAGIF